MSLPGQLVGARRRPPARRLRLRRRAGRVVAPARRGHPAPPDHDQGGLRERHRRRHGPRRLDQRRAPPAGHRQRGAGRPGARRLQPGRRRGCPTSPTPSPTAATTWPTSTASAASRSSCASSSTAGLLHGDCLTVTGRTDGREPGRARPARPRRRGRPPALRPHPRRRRASPSSRGSLAPEGAGGEGGRPRQHAVRRHGPGVRRRAGGAGGHPGRRHPAGHGGRHPLRGPEGRPRHARDAGRHRGDEGGRARRGLRPRDRRPLLGGHPRVLHRPRRPRSGRRRPHRPRGRRRPDRHRRGRPTGSSSTSRPPSSAAAATSSSTPSRATPRGPWPSTPGS